LSTWRVTWVEEAAAWVAEKQETEKSLKGEARATEGKMERRRIVSDAHFWVHCPPRGGTGLILAAARHRAPDKTKRLLACMWLLLGFFYVAK